MQDTVSNRLGTERVGTLIFRLALPAIMAQIINLLYTLVDRIYIGRIEGVGALALTGVGVTLPLIMFITACSSLVGMGGAPRVSIFMGSGDYTRAHKTLGSCFTFLCLLSLLLTLFFLLFARPLLLSFGASANTVVYALEYFNVYTLGTVFVLFTLGLNPFITAQGFAKTSMFTVMIGAVCNIILDPIFIFGFGMGVRGAALATILSQALSCLWVLLFLTGKKPAVRLQAKHMKIEKSLLLSSLALGLSPFIMQSTESLLAIAFNSSLLRYGGDLAVGSMTILTSVMQLTMMPLQGLTQGAQPVISYNYGAGNAPRVKHAFFLLLRASLIYTGGFWLIVMANPEFFVRLFSEDTALIAFAASALRIYMFASFAFGAQIACQYTFIALGNAKSSLFLALLRKIILLIPLIYILPAIFTEDKTTSVFMAEPIADFIAVVATVTLFRLQFRKALQGMPQRDKP